MNENVVGRFLTYSVQCCCEQMVNVTRESSNRHNAELIYYLIQFYNNDSLTLTAAEDTCRLILLVDKQQAALILRYVIVSLCLS